MIIMAKKLLSEAVVRRFAKLANISAVNEGVYQEEEETVEETITPNGRTPITEEEEEEELELGAEEAPLPPEEPPLPEEEPMDMDASAGELDLTDEEAQAIIDLGKKLEAAMPEGGAEELPAEEPMDDMAGEELPAEEPMGDMADEEEEIMEALKGIQYIPEKKEIVEEVARRVAKRLLKAKKAETALNEALGKKNKTSARRRSRK